MSQVYCFLGTLNLKPLSEILKSIRPSGTSRCKRLYNAALEGADSAPVDLRFLQRPFSDKKGKKGDDVRSDVASYLAQLYESVAEVLPDVRDDAFDSFPSSSSSVPGALKDAYSIELNNQARAASGPASSEPKLLLAEKTRKPRKMRGAIKLNSDRLAGPHEGAKEIRKLPPGAMKEFWEQYRLVSALEEPASFPTFWRAPCLGGF